MDLTAEFYLQTVETVFVKHLLPNGLMTHRGRPVRTETIRRTALLTVEGERDDISGVGQTKAAHALCTNLPYDKKQHFLAMGVGHYGVFNGSRFRSRDPAAHRRLHREAREGEACRRSQRKRAGLSRELSSDVILGRAERAIRPQGRRTSDVHLWPLGSRSARPSVTGSRGGQFFRNCRKVGRRPASAAFIS